MNIHEDLWKAFNDIYFDDEDGKHEYTDSQGTKFQSATGWAGSFSEPFNADKVLTEMSERRVKAGKDPLTPEEKFELKEKWEYAGEYARKLGTEVHSVMENLWYKKNYNFNKELLKTHPEMWNDFVERKKKCKALFRQLRRVYAPVANEFIVYDAEDGLCGTIDMLAYNMKKGTYAIFDWKTSKEFKKDDPFGGKTLKAPFDDLPECNVSEYSLQLSLYKYLLEKHTSIRISEMFLFQIPGADKAFGDIQPVYDLSGRIAEYLKKQKAEKVE